MNKINGLAANPLTTLQNLKGKKSPEAIKEIAVEMETIFADMMLKAMKETTGSMFGEGYGGQMYMSLFDTELSKIVANRGLGLRDMFVRELTRLSEKSDSVAHEDVSLKKSSETTDKEL